MLDRLFNTLKLGSAGVLLLLVTVWASSAAPLLAQTQTQPAPSQEAKSILVLYSASFYLPAYRKNLAAFFSVMEGAGFPANRLHFEYLDLIRESGPEHRRKLLDLLRVKYTDKKIDLIITVEGLARDLILKDGRDLLPGAPLLAILSADAIDAVDSMRPVVQIPSVLDMAGTLQLGLSLFPETRRVFVVLGNGEDEQRWERDAKAKFSPWTDLLEFEYSSELTYEETLQRIGSLPPGTIVIYIALYKDKTGRAFVPRDAAIALTRRANVPVFGVYDEITPLLVGGSMISYGAEGARAARLALEILAGQYPLSEPLITLPILTAPIFNWQQLERWGVSNRQLPAGSNVINRPPSIWDDYREYVLGGAALIALQTGMILALLAMRRRNRKAEAKRREAEERYRRIVDTANEGILTIDASLRIDFVNQKMADMLGYTQEEMTGQFSETFILPEDLEAHHASIGTRRRGMGETYERRFLRKDGKAIWFQVNAAPIIDDRGRFAGSFAMFTDFSERKLMEERLRESRRFLSELIENSGALIFVKDRLGRYELVNRKWEEVAGLQRSDVLGKTDEELFPGETGRQFRANDVEVMDAGRVLEKEEILEGASGKRFFLSVKFPLFDTDGGIRGICGMTTEITERKRAEEALERRLIALSRPLDDVEGLDFHDLFNLEDIQRVQDLFAKATGVASIITLPDGAPITQASNFCRLCSEIIRTTELGLKNCFASDAVLGAHHPHGPIVQPCLSGGLWDAGASITVGGKHLANWLIGQVRNEKQDEQSMREYARAIGADEEHFMAAFREVPTMSEEKFREVADALFALANQLSTVAYQNVQQARFITERKRAEEEKAQAEAQLLQAQKMEAIGTLAGGIAHDFNNILGAILGYAELARDDAEAGQLNPHDLEQIIMSAERAKALVQQIMTFSRKVEPKRTPLDLNLEVARAMELLEHTLPKMIATKLLLSPDLHRVYADAGQLSQVIVNLAANAFHAMPEGGEITVTTENVSLSEKTCHTCGERFSGDWVALRISDTGQGIHPDDLSRIFDPFFTTKEVGKGTGLGLSMVHGIVQSHGGHIECQSQLGQGTTFTIYLAAFDQDEAGPGEEDPEIAAITGGDETIMLVDDEEPLRLTGQRILTAMGYRVIAARSGEEALGFYRDPGAGPDLVVMDLGMPGMGGYKAMKTILGIDPKAKVLIASGYAASGQVKSALEAGAAGYVAKPFRRTELLATVRSVLDAK